MTAIDLANISEEWDGKNNWIYCRYTRGSNLYGTADENSDNDFLIVAKDNVTLIPDKRFVDDSCAKVDKRIFQTDFKNNDVEVVKYTDFISLIEEQSPLALEAILSIEEGNSSRNDVFRQLYKVNTWKLRENFGSIANNSFVKAKKKMTVKESYDFRCALKSLFHSIRLLMFACQIAETGTLTDVRCAVPLWYEILKDANDGFEWEDFKKKYKPMWNEWHSKMVKLCPRPKEFFKNNK